MKNQELRCVKISFKEGSFVRFDFVKFAFTINRKDGFPEVRVSGLINCLMDYAQFYASTDEALCSFDSKELTMRQFMEAKIIAEHYRRHRMVQMPRFWRFVRHVFPEYSPMYAK